MKTHRLGDEAGHADKMMTIIITMIITKYDENDNGASAAATDDSGGNTKWEKTIQKLTMLHFIKYYLDDSIVNTNTCTTSTSQVKIY